MVKTFGQAPVLRYEVNDGNWRASVMLDDVAGNIVVEFESRHFFGHWWSVKTNKANSLREVLVTFNEGYIEDKFSYGLDRWDGEKARAALIKLVEDKYGKLELDERGRANWSCDLEEAVDAVEDGWSSDAFYGHLLNNYVFNEMWQPGEGSFGETYANKHVTNFVKRMWPQLVEHWRKEIENVG